MTFGSPEPLTRGKVLSLGRKNASNTMGARFQRRLLTSFPALAGLAFLAACAAGGTGSGGEKTPAPIACPDLVPAPPTMISPANGAAGVADGKFSLILNAQASLFTFTLTAAGGTTVPLPSPSQVPLPSASPGQTGFALAVPTLQAATTYTVVAENSGGAGCPTTTDSIGTFTTQ